MADMRYAVPLLEQEQMQDARLKGSRYKGKGRSLVVPIQFIGTRSG